MITIATLRAAGLTEAQILRVLEIEQTERLAIEREQNRIRSRNYRARHATKRDAVTPVTPVTRDDRDAYVCKTLFPNLEIKKVRKKETHTLRENWTPSEADRDYARAKGWSDDRIDNEAERFRLYHIDKGDLIKDDHRSWCKWVTSPYQNGSGSNGRGRRHGSVLDAGDRIGQRLYEAGATDDYVPGSEGPRPLQLDQTVRASRLKLLPKR